MEQQNPNPPEIAKRVWSVVRIMYYMLTKGISKGKLMADLNMMMKRGKIPRKKAIHNMFHTHSPSSSSATFVAPKEYEFSCSNSPAFPFSIKKHIKNHSSFFGCAHASATVDEDDRRMTVDAVKKVLEMLNSNEVIEESSPALPGFGRSPTGRQLRVTDSPFPLHNIDEDSHVDEKAEKFIAKFYSELWRQTIMASPGPR